MRRFWTVVLSVVFPTVVLWTSVAAAKDAYTMGVHPYKPPQELYKKFKPIADYLSKKLGKPVNFMVGLDYKDTVAKIGKGDFDFAYLGPTLYVEAHDTYGVQPLAMVANNGKPSFHGVIVTKKGSGITSLAQLKGKSFAFGERGSTLNHVVPLAMLMDAGVKLTDLKEYKFLGSHDNVAMNIIRGTFTAAGLQPDAFETYKAQGLEGIATSPELPEHVFVAAKKLDPKTVQTLQNSLLLPEAQPLYKEIKGSISNVQKFADADFNVLRKIMKQVAPEMNK